jgi:hypothetical protein
MLWAGVILIALSVGLMFHALLHYNDVPNFDWTTMERTSEGNRWYQ